MDLFQTSEKECLADHGADIALWRHVDFGNETELLKQLIADTPWKSEQITVWGKTYTQPRLIAWYGDNSQKYSYSSVSLNALPMTPLLLRLRDQVEALCESTFDSVLLNYYRNQHDGMGFHADDEPELGPCPAIASVSLGATRQFVLKHKNRREVKNVKLPLLSGSLLLMKGETQNNWKHGVPKVSKLCGPRVNLTFRKILS